MTPPDRLGKVGRGVAKTNHGIGLLGTETFGSRPEPGTHSLALILFFPPGEVPEDPARAHLQSTWTCPEAHSEAGEVMKGLALPDRCTVG